MTKTYIPTEICLDGQTYFEGVQEVPEIVALFIDNHPVLSKMKEPKAVDTYRHLKGLSLTELESLLRDEYQLPIERVTHNLNVKRQMGESEFQLRKQIQNLDRLKVEYSQLLDYLEPILAERKEEEQRLNKRLQAWAEGFGGHVSVTSSGYPAIHVPRQTVIVSRGTK